MYLRVQFISQSAPNISRKLCQLEKGPETPWRDFLEITFKVFNNMEEEAKKEKERMAKYALFAASIQEKFQPLWPIDLGPPIWDLTCQAPASDITKWDAGLSPTQTPSHPPNPVPPANNEATGKWIVLRH